MSQKATPASQGLKDDDGAEHGEEVEGQGNSGEGYGQREVPLKGRDELILTSKESPKMS